MDGIDWFPVATALRPTFYVSEMSSGHLCLCSKDKHKPGADRRSTCSRAAVFKCFSEEAFGVGAVFVQRACVRAQERLRPDAKVPPLRQPSQAASRPILARRLGPACFQDNWERHTSTSNL